jgi:hypothetical protein
MRIMDINRILAVYKRPVSAKRGIRQCRDPLLPLSSPALWRTLPPLRLVGTAAVILMLKSTILRSVAVKPTGSGVETSCVLTV